MAYCTQAQRYCITFPIAGSDYNTMNGQLLFQPEMANQSQCANISIISDEILEVNEIFLVMLVNGSVRVDLSQPVTTVTILDNDSKLINLKWNSIDSLLTDLLYSGISWATAGRV